MGQNQHSFHFVNKTPLSISLSRSQGQARFEIFRHAKLKPSKSSNVRSISSDAQDNHTSDPLARRTASTDDLEDTHTIVTPSSNVDAVQRKPRGPVATRPLRNLTSGHAPGITYLEGSCDPFNAQSVVITPKINQLISFIRDSYIPGLYVTPFMRNFSRECPRYTTIENIRIALGGTEAVKNWNHLRKSLSSDGGASAWVASWIPCILQFVEKSELRGWYLTGLKMRAHSIQALRKTLSEGTKSDTHQLGIPVLLHVLYLFRADCVMGDTQAATAHAQMLRPLIEAMEDPFQQAELLVIVLYNDCEMQIAKMQRTLFDPYNWVPDRLANFWRKAETLLPDVGEEYKDLHSSINNASVREIAIRLRRCLLIGRTPMGLRDPITVKLGEYVYNWMATITLCDMGILVAVYLDLIEYETDSMTPGERFTEAALTIAVLQILRKSMHSMTVDNTIDRRDFSHIIIPQLRWTLEQALDFSTPVELSYYREAYLWMFYIGTYYEQRLRKYTDAATIFTPEEQWFSGKFIQQSRLLGFSTWKEVEENLGMFVVNSYLYLGQSLETWFHDAVDKIDATVSHHLASTLALGSTI